MKCHHVTALLGAGMIVELRQLLRSRDGCGTRTELLVAGMAVALTELLTAGMAVAW